MAASFEPSRSALSPHFELRTSAGGVAVVVRKGEAWAPDAAAAAPPRGVGGSASSGAAAGGASSLLGGLLGGAMAAVLASAAPPPPAAAAAPPPRVWRASTLSPEARMASVLSVGEECIQEEELRALLLARAHPVCYDGFEPSGRMHIAQGVLKAINVNRLTRAGCVFKFWVADWFALLNNKMGGDLAKIRVVGRYMVEVWRAAGMEMENVEFLWASDEINARANDYWLRVMDVARAFNVPRIVRCCTIMGRKEGDDLSAAQILYPCMQCADVFFLRADICQLGMDQRKVNMLAREYCDAASPKIRFKPVILSHHMLAGLKEGQEKMSKSDPDSAIWMEDEASEVKRKVKQAYCPPGVVAGNPCLDWTKHIVFGKFPEGVTVKRGDADGGNTLYTTYEALEADFAAGKLHPGDLKATLVEYLNVILEPVRQHFKQGEPAKLLEQVKKFRVTR